jgi:hypothetical protein
MVGSQPRQIVPQSPILEIPITQIGLVEWLKLKALSSSLSTAKKKKRKKKTKKQELKNRAKREFSSLLDILKFFDIECMPIMF